MLKFSTPHVYWLPLCALILLVSSYGTVAEEQSDPEALVELGCGEYDLQGRLIQGERDSPFPDSIEVYAGPKLIKRVRIKDLPRLTTQSYRDRFVRVRADVLDTEMGTEDARARLVEFHGSVTQGNATREGIRQIHPKACKKK